MCIALRAQDLEVVLACLRRNGVSIIAAVCTDHSQTLAGSLVRQPFITVSHYV
jgi:hypothetical protein